MTTMTLQDIFNKAAVHLLTQNRRATANEGFSGGCRYRMEDGRMCAVGVLIPPQVYAKYSKDIEGSGVSSAEVKAALVDAGILSGMDFHLMKAEEYAREYAKLNMLSGLQVIHDERLPEAWRECLIDLAQAYRLDDSAVTNFQPT